MAEHGKHYPTFNVMNEEPHWDPHTREIVENRLQMESFEPYRYLTRHEGHTLYRVCSILLDDDRDPVISYVVSHFDTSLQAGLGESQRKIGVPKQSDLVRGGIAALDQACEERYGLPFIRLDGSEQQEIIFRMVQGYSALPNGAIDFPVKDWIHKVLTEAVAAYYSHPAIWSEIGYAGPAYPRGYVRSELGLTDPWEARRDGN